MRKLFRNLVCTFLLLLCFSLTSLPTSPCSAVTIGSLNLSTEVAYKGDSILISGEATPETWLTLKIVDEKGNIVFFDALRTNNNGSYAVDFIVPEIEPCTLTVVSGIGENTLAKNLIVRAKKKKSSAPELPPAQSNSIKTFSLTLSLGNNIAQINGKSVTMDVAPYLHPQSNRTMLPIRFIGESLGAQVQWLSATKEIIINKNGHTILLSVDHDVAIINGQNVKIDCPPRLLSSGRTFVPVRFISESLGASVDWDSATGEITISQ